MTKSIPAPEKISPPISIESPASAAKRFSVATDSFNNRQLTAASESRIEFLPSYTFRLITLVALGLGAGLIGHQVWQAWAGNPQEWPTFLIGIGFLAVGAIMASQIPHPAIFDKSQGWYWKNNSGGPIPSHAAQSATQTPLAHIKSLEWVLKKGNSSDEAHDCYELMLVLENAERMKVTSYGNLESLQRDMDRLAAFLEVAAQ